MIKQSTIDIVNSTTQALTVTYAAIETTTKEYRNILSKLITLLEETTMYEVSDSHWDYIVAVRSELQEKKETMTQLVGYMDQVHKMALTASEVCYLAGMDNLSMTLCQRIDDALRNVQKEMDQVQKLENDYRYVQQQCILKSNAQDVLRETEEKTAAEQSID